MTVKIYRPAKNAMQSGKAQTREWLLEFEPETPRFHDPVMGWVGSSDMKQELKMFFPTKEKAIAYALKEGLDFKVIEPQKPKIIIKSYADNFKAS
jgi:hypothetical protein